MTTLPSTHLLECLRRRQDRDFSSSPTCAGSISGEESEIVYFKKSLICTFLKGPQNRHRAVGTPLYGVTWRVLWTFYTSMTQAAEPTFSKAALKSSTNCSSQFLPWAQSKTPLWVWGQADLDARVLVLTLASSSKDTPYFHQPQCPKRQQVAKGYCSPVGVGIKQGFCGRPAGGQGGKIW